MPTTIRLSDLKNLSPRARDAALRDLARAAQASPNGALTQVEAQIRAFERRHEMSSATMRARLAAGALDETAEIASWLIALDVQRRMLGR